MTTRIAPHSIRGRWHTWAAIGRYVLLSLLALVFLFPIVYMLMSSLKPNAQLLQDSASLRAFLPIGDISFNNYRAAFIRAPTVRFISNSILVTTLTVLLGLLVNSLAGFSLACLRWKGQGLVLILIIATL